MNPHDQQTSTNLATYQEPSHNAAALILDPISMKSMTDLAAMMASGKTTVPGHLKGNTADCMAIVLQAMQWQMNPFAVAQKTFIVQGGALSYEAQLVNAVITSKAPTLDRLHYEWFGDWDKIIGNFREVESKTKKDDDTGLPKKYRLPNWNIADEKGLGIKVWATFKGESEPRELTTLMTQARTRNSTLWADDPKQQIAYLATKKWARLYCPDVILGVYTPDELDDGYGNREIDITPAGERPQSDKPADLGAAAVPTGDSSNETEALYGELMEIAKHKGILEYEKAWKALKPKQRSAIGLQRHESLKQMANTVDAEFTEVKTGDQATGSEPASE